MRTGANSLFLFLRPRKGRCRLLAHRVVPCLAQKSVAIGGGADMDDRAAMDDGDVNDPSLPFHDQSCCDAQRRFLTHRWGNVAVRSLRKGPHEATRVHHAASAARRPRGRSRRGRSQQLRFCALARRQRFRGLFRFGSPSSKDCESLDISKGKISYSSSWSWVIKSFKRQRQWRQCTSWFGAKST